ncbi:MarR family winged helix-turn-helix transcriptional regulator [uncultured Roseovarius sp.]|uniref:MarR family winged helix-turn-helix transcriptional regulator n=1 Tax=uncultured Roseovarius sp. TaxID=293344 RepID=UPI002617A0E9|nr:MarR family winged helix-turn-helix transcriptional regulator [uncultured Roseovarius sp.]
MGIDDFRLARFLPYRLAVLSERISRRLSAIYGAEAGLSVAEWRVMVHLARCREVSVREIHNCVNLDKSRVSRAVTRLETAGLVQKTGSPTDQRLLAISLSPEGWHLLDRIVPPTVDYEARLLAALSDADCAALDTIIEKLHRVLDADPEARPRSVLDLPQPPDAGDASAPNDATIDRTP